MNNMSDINNQHYIDTKINSTTEGSLSTAQHNSDWELVDKTLLPAALAIKSNKKRLAWWWLGCPHVVDKNDCLIPIFWYGTAQDKLAKLAKPKHVSFLIAREPLETHGYGLFVFPYGKSLHETIIISWNDFPQLQEALRLSEETGFGGNYLWSWSEDSDGMTKIKSRHTPYLGLLNKGLSFTLSPAQKELMSILVYAHDTETFAPWQIAEWLGVNAEYIKNEAAHKNLFATYNDRDYVIPKTAVWHWLLSGYKLPHNLNEQQIVTFMDWAG